MKFFEEARIFVGVILKWLYYFLGAFLFVFIFGLKEFFFRGKTINLPFPSHDSFTVLLFKNITSNVIPSDVELIVTSPLEAFWAQITIAFFLAIVITFPILLYNLLKYIFPAFNKKEKTAIFKVLIPSAVLFFLGCAFSYYFLIPSTIELLYVYYAKTIGVTAFFSLKEFIPLILAFSFGVGVIFTIPVFMVILSSLGFIDPVFWKNNWKYSFLFFLLFSAIITPDGSGITMLFLTLPLIFLYFIGYVVSKNTFSRKKS